MIGGMHVQCEYDEIEAKIEVVNEVVKALIPIFSLSCPAVVLSSRNGSYKTTIKAWIISPKYLVSDRGVLIHEYNGEDVNQQIKTIIEQVHKTAKEIAGSCVLKQNNTRVNGCAVKEVVG